MVKQWSWRSTFESGPFVKQFFLVRTFPVQHVQYCTVAEKGVVLAVMVHSIKEINKEEGSTDVEQLD
jgi:hypothetical protein